MQTLFSLADLFCDFSGAHQGKSARENVRITEDAFDSHFFCLRRHNIKRHGGERDTDKYHATTWTERFKQALHCALIAAGFENNIRSPAFSGLFHNIRKILLAHIYRRDARIFGGEL